jgi:hypothetical protein
MVEILEMDGTHYLYSEGEQRIYRINLEEKNRLVKRYVRGVNSSITILIVSSTNLMGESCEGDKCSECSFASGGGCACGTMGGMCNHTISR